MSEAAFREQLFITQDKAFRNPAEIFGSPFEMSAITSQTLLSIADPAFIELLYRLEITLVVGREYEHLVLALHASQNNSLKQTFFHLPHPSGIAYDPFHQSLFIASTRNPNQIIELKKASSGKLRIDSLQGGQDDGIFIPARAKFYPGHYYFHDLVFIGSQLYANSVGQNGIILVDMNSARLEELCWWPKCVEMEDGRPNTAANFIQLNSIAAGKTLEESFFSASSDEITSLRPGHPDYQVNKRGVVFSGKTRDAIMHGLTRPHSARIYDKKIWINNSGYGEFGYLDVSRFIPIVALGGWTRGLAIKDGIAFVGISRILPKFKAYAPGIHQEASCAIAAIELISGKILGKIEFPYGNQIFAIEMLPRNVLSGFAYETIQDSYEKEIALFYNYNIRKDL